MGKGWRECGVARQLGTQRMKKYDSFAIFIAQEWRRRGT